MAVICLNIPNCTKAERILSLQNVEIKLLHKKIVQITASTRTALNASYNTKLMCSLYIKNFNQTTPVLFSSILYVWL